MAEPSGRFWVSWANQNAPNSNQLDALAEPFRTSATAFVNALRNAGARVQINATRRHPKRAYLFHWCWKIGLGRAQASNAATEPGVDIQWDHGAQARSMAGAREMIDGFGLAVPPESNVPPARRSKHVLGTAIDMEVSWAGVLSVRSADGETVRLPFVAEVDANLALHELGAGYRVKKLVGDAPHWSDTGR